MTSPSKVQKTLSETKDTRWEMATRPIRRALSGWILELNGYSEVSSGPVTRRELPAPQIVVIFEFGPPIRVLEGEGQHGGRSFNAGFVAGLDDTFTFTEHAGMQSGIQLNLTPLGARRFFDMPMSELAGQVAIDWAYRRIDESNGSVSLSELALQLGYSHKHMIDLFKDRVGLPPKLLARLVRFDRVMTDLKSGSRRPWGELAARFGYADQSHLIRDVRKFTGTTPTRAQELIEAWPAV